MSTEILEKEVKIRIGNLSAIVKRLSELSPLKMGTRIFEYNVVFDHNHLNLKSKHQLLRLRKYGDEVSVTFKTKAEQAGSNVKIRKEWETGVESFDTLYEIFTGLGFIEKFVYEKYRQKFQYGSVAVCVDETPIGNYIEIEGDEAQIDAFAEELGFGISDYITSTYLKLFKEAGGSGHMRFDE